MFGWSTSGFPSSLPVQQIVSFSLLSCCWLGELKVYLIKVSVLFCFLSRMTLGALVWGFNVNSWTLQEMVRAWWIIRWFAEKGQWGLWPDYRKRHVDCALKYNFLQVLGRGVLWVAKHRSWGGGPLGIRKWYRLGTDQSHFLASIIV